MRTTNHSIDKQEAVFISFETTTGTKYRILFVGGRDQAIWYNGSEVPLHNYGSHSDAVMEACEILEEQYDK